MKKNKLLICTLVMAMILTVMPGMTSYAAEAEGEIQPSATELQDENSQRLEEVTAMDESGNIYEIEDTDGAVAEEESNGIARFAMRSAGPQVVNFNTKGSAVTSYTDVNGGSGYTNGAYGADAAYLGMTSDGKVRFMLSGVTGTVNASEVQVLDYAEVANNVSYYAVSGGTLYHYISQNLNTAPVSALNNGPAPSYLSEGVKYYSYDGHYFYTDYSVMLSDYQNNCNGASAVNSGNRFENYFQFLDMNSSTGYSGDELNSILHTALENAGKSLSSSKLTGTGSTFVKYQDTYSVNALLSLGIAINESAWGTSYICQTKNNIFGLNAVDSNTGNADVFNSIEDCIRDFMANWMAGGYLDSSDWRNHGEYLGNKGGGINVSYASDPYWGEKAAAHAWNLDSVGGNQDYIGETEEPDTETPPVTEEPDTETPPVTEEPDAETPPVTEEPDTETPPVTEEPDTETPPVTEEPDAETPPVTEEPDTETPPLTEGSDTETPPVTEESDTETPSTGDEVQTPGEETDSPAETQQTVSDASGRVTVSGKLSEGATVRVSVIEPNTDAYTNYVSAEPVKGKTVLGVYDITLNGSMEGEAQLTFHVDEKYNGKDAVILHYADDGTYETYKVKVENGQVTVSVKGFSPYVLALDESSSNTDTKSPKTGDLGSAAGWLALLGASAVLGIGVLLKRRKVN